MLSFWPRNTSANIYLYRDLPLKTSTTVHYDNCNFEIVFNSRKSCQIAIHSTVIWYTIIANLYTQKSNFKVDLRIFCTSERVWKIANRLEIEHSALSARFRHHSRLLYLFGILMTSASKWHTYVILITFTAPRVKSR